MGKGEQWPTRGKKKKEKREKERKKKEGGIS